LIISPRSVTGSGNGEESAFGLHVSPRTATDSGSGESNSSFLHRADKRGKELPPALLQALTKVASSSQ
jgi:hypothetical protein